MNYVIYHELAHALPDGFTDISNPDREKIANEYGQMLSEQMQVVYPTDAELSVVGGTVTR